MKSRSLNILLALALLLAACKVHRTEPKVAEANPNGLPAKRPDATGPAVTYPYRPSADKAFDLVHTTLKVDFDWVREQMHGEATLTMQPWFAPQSTVDLDAKGFILHQVALETPSGRRDLNYTYDNEHLHIVLDRPYLKSESLNVYIRYTARPSELDSLVSEEAAGDQGLYFINPRGEAVGKPRQIWTQGESHGSPAWFPTFDTPNQRCTDDIYITVADSFKTLSNGLLVDAQPHPDGTRTDHWRMDLPHSPYLFTMAIGNYTIVKEQWRGREVSYYVEPAFAQYAHLVFGETPEMIEFFSTRLGVDYPWPKYAQVVVRDFVSGAMENTSATTHYGRLQHDAREHLDAPEEDIISHELFHQWFGDLVTCESWANLSLNEGFATYGEYLWVEHKYGADQAAMHLLDDRQGYLRSSRRGIYPIIRYHHKSADAMFDAHSYAKGGQVLHMLRHVVGDDAFFAALKLYLTDNAFDDVEIHKLRLAFEQVTGQDLNWFFDQWFLQPGHPVLEIEQAYANGKFTLHVDQVQDLAVSPVFRLPITLDFVVGAKHKRIEVWMETVDTTFTFEVNAAPSHVSFDPERVLLCEIAEFEGVADAAWQHQLETGGTFAQKSEAVGHLIEEPLDDKQLDAILALSKDAFWGTRMLALAPVEVLTDAQVAPMTAVALQLSSDSKSDVRAAAIDFLAAQIPFLQKPEHAALKMQVSDRVAQAVTDSSYVVGRAALETYYLLDPTAGTALAERLMTGSEKHLFGPIARILREASSPLALPFILKQIQDPAASLSIKTSLLRGFGTWLDKRSPAEKEQGVAVLKTLVTGSGERWVRFFAMQCITEMTKTDALRAFVQAQMSTEQDEILKTAMQRYLDAK
jgi:aminopeptidase N